MADDLIFDAWTPMSFKRALDPTNRIRGRSFEAPTWVGDHDRRLLAYTVLGAYFDNAARHFLATTDVEKRNAHREYGDANLMRAQTMSALLGDDQRWATDGAEDVPAVEEDEDGNQVDPEGQPVEVDEEEFAPLQLQEWVEGWAEAERFPVKLQECERSAVGLGDGVYVLGWSNRKQRPTLRVYEPGFYFPVLDPMSDEEFPRRVHIAWELPKGEDGKTRIRRMTWELGPITLAQATPGSDEDFVLRDGDRWDDQRGLIVRAVPWSDEPATETCYFSDGVWTLDAEKQTVDDLTGDAAEWQTNEDGDELVMLDTGYDFLPVVHVPNTIAGADHYGTSALAHILQILDDLANADTDLQAASGTTGTPPLALSGAQMQGDPVYAPGAVWVLGENGKLSALDTSPQMTALANYVDGLLDRLSVNGRMPAALLGRVDPSEVPSGLALQLSFGPLVSMVREMRLVRDEKYVLLAKFAQRIALAGGAPDVPTFYAPTRLRFGSFLPADVTAAVQAVTQLLNAKAISVETGVRMLMDAGLPIEDAAQEVVRILARDFAGANELLDATGDQGVVDRYLGVERTAERPPPPPPEPPEPPEDPLAEG